MQESGRKSEKCHFKNTRKLNSYTKILNSYENHDFEPRLLQRILSSILTSSARLLSYRTATHPSNECDCPHLSRSAWRECRGGSFNGSFRGSSDSASSGVNFRWFLRFSFSAAAAAAADSRRLQGFAGPGRNELNLTMGVKARALSLKPYMAIQVDSVFCFGPALFPGVLSVTHIAPSPTRPLVPTLTDAHLHTHTPGLPKPLKPHTYAREYPIPNFETKERSPATVETGPVSRPKTVSCTYFEHTRKFSDCNTREPSLNLKRVFLFRHGKVPIQPEIQHSLLCGGCTTTIQGSPPSALNEPEILSTSSANPCLPVARDTPRERCGHVPMLNDFGLSVFKYRFRSQGSVNLGIIHRSLVRRWKKPLFSRFSLLHDPVKISSLALCEFAPCVHWTRNFIGPVLPDSE